MKHLSLLILGTALVSTPVLAQRSIIGSIIDIARSASTRQPQTRPAQPRPAPPPPQSDAGLGEDEFDAPEMLPERNRPTTMAQMAQQYRSYQATCGAANYTACYMKDVVQEMMGDEFYSCQHRLVRNCGLPFNRYPAPNKPRAMRDIDPPTWHVNDLIRSMDMATAYCSEVDDTSCDDAYRYSDNMSHVPYRFAHQGRRSYYVRTRP